MPAFRLTLENQLYRWFMSTEAPGKRFRQLAPGLSCHTLARVSKLFLTLRLHRSYPATAAVPSEPRKCLLPGQVASNSPHPIREHAKTRAPKRP